MRINTGRKHVFELTDGEQKVLDYLKIRTTNKIKEMAQEYGKSYLTFNTMLYKVKDKCGFTKTCELLEWVDKGETNE